MAVIARRLSATSAAPREGGFRLRGEEVLVPGVIHQHRRPAAPAIGDKPGTEGQAPSGYFRKQRLYSLFQEAGQ